MWGARTIASSPGKPKNAPFSLASLSSGRASYSTLKAHNTDYRNVSIGVSFRSFYFKSMVSPKLARGGCKISHHAYCGGASTSVLTCFLLCVKLYHVELEIPAKFDQSNSYSDIKLFMIDGSLVLISFERIVTECSNAAIISSQIFQ